MFSSSSYCEVSVNNSSISGGYVRLVSALNGASCLKLLRRVCTGIYHEICLDEINKHIPVNSFHQIPARIRSSSFHSGSNDGRVEDVVF